MTGNGTASALPWHGPAQRIGAMVLRHTYLLRRSWPRLLELTYWPTVQVIIWGLVTMFLITNSSWFAQAAGVLLAGVILWDIMFRGQIGLSLVFIEEMWSRNLGHLFVSPLRPWELICALMLISLIRTLIGMTGAVGFAFILYAFSIFDLGFALIGFFVNLIVMGWAVGFFVCGLVLRFGLGAESLAWFLIFALAPFSCVYYPLSILPDWLEPVAAILPSAHVFEGMRALVVDGIFSGDHMMRATTLNIGWMAAGVGTFLAFLRSARIRGLLHQIGE
ncbi:MAG: ABC transporter permease [Rhodospirillaceae bacterium]|nr:ABC transporter permease [Rhodospirillaceae bacterium]